jgi:hypothetical protein
LSSAIYAPAPSGVPVPHLTASGVPVPHLTSPKAIKKASISASLWPGADAADEPDAPDAVRPMPM